MKDQTIQPITLALPKGGGAKTSLGETFQANEFSGTANLSIPIHTSPCREFAPNLELSYSSGNGNGVFGFGFDLPLPSVTRRTRLGTPRYNNLSFRSEPDVYLFNGQELVPASVPSKPQTENSVSYNVKNYIPRKQEDFNLIEFWQPANTPDQPGFWKVTSRDHVVSIYGFSKEAVISNPDDETEVFTWLLQEVFTPEGDHRVYLYKPEDTKFKKDSTVPFPQKDFYSGHQSEANKYLKSILYGNITSKEKSLLIYNDPAVSDPSKWHFEVVFDYGEYGIGDSNKNPYQTKYEWECRADPFSSYNAGFEIRTYRRCKQILMFHRFEKELGKDPVLVHGTKFDYSHGFSKNSLCTGVIETGYYLDIKSREYKSQSMPGLTFSYSDFSPKGWAFKNIAEELKILNSDGYSLIDLFGEGIPGVLFSNDHANFFAEPDSDKKGNTSGSFKSWKSLDSFPSASLDERKQDVFLQDVTGNSKVDLVSTGNGGAGYWEAQSNQTWKPFQTFEKWPADFKAKGQRWVDLTGDGIADLAMITKNSVNYYPNMAGGGFGSQMIENNSKSIPHGNSSSQTELLTFSDLVGTGKDHLVRIRSGEVKYWPNLSFGRFGDPVSMINAPKIDDFNVANLRLADLDGSGGADLLYFASNKLSIYFNQNGNAYSNSLDISFPTGVTFDQLDDIILSDVYGNGNTCLILVEQHASEERQFWCYDFCGGNKPYLLQKVDNNLGANTQISYKSSVHYYLADRENGLPWVTALPMPVQVVSEIVQSDLISKATNTTAYFYHHGFYDTIEREFRGFGRVDREQKESIQIKSPDTSIVKPYVAPRKTITWYHTGAFFEKSDLADQYKKEYFSKDDKVFNLPPNEYDWGKINPDSETQRQACVALAGAVIRSEKYDLSLENNDFPISVSTSNFAINLKQAKADSGYAVFFTTHRETLNSLYECIADDPRISYEASLEVDDFGNVTKSIDIAYPRRCEKSKDKNKKLAQQKGIKLLCHSTTFVNQDKEPKSYLLGVSTETRSYEVQPITSGDKRFDGQSLIKFEDLQVLIKNKVDPLEKTNKSSSVAILRSWQRTIYKDPKSGDDLSFGDIGFPLLVSSNQVAVIDGDEAKSIFKDAIGGNDLDDMFNSGDFTQDASTGQMWWNPGLTQSFAGLHGFYLVKDIQDKNGNKTSYAYDEYHLIAESTTDALENVVKYLSIDYQHLSALQLLDINNNTFEVRLDPLGRVVYSSFYGTENGEQSGFSPLGQVPEISEPTLEDILKQPVHYLDNAQSFYFYDMEAWKKDQSPALMVQVLAQQYPSELKAGERILADVKSEIGKSSGQQSSVHWSIALFRKVIGALKTLHAKIFKSDKDKAKAMKITEVLMKGAKSDDLIHEVLEDLPHITINYSDGLGRMICTKKNAEPGQSLVYDEATKKITESNNINNRWLTSGYQVRDSSGKTIQNFEPYFINTPDYLPDESLKNHGVSDTMYFDAQDRLVQKLSAKGFLATHQWQAWSQKSSDANSTLSQSPYYKSNVTKPDPSSSYYDKTLTVEAKKALADISKNFSSCAVENTFDNQGHVIISQQTFITDDPSQSQKLETHFTYDILGRLLTSADPRLSPLGKFNFQYTYNLIGEKIHTVSADAGDSFLLNNAFGLPLWASNGRKTSVSTYYDELHRPLAKHVKKQKTADDLLELDQAVEYLVYGDAKDATVDPAKNNLRGKVIKHYDQAGLLSVSGYNLLGKATGTARKLNLDGKNESNWGSDFAKISISSLSQAETKLLQTQAYQHEISYDGLGRTTSETDPDGNIAIPTYHLSGWLSQVSVNTKDDNGEIDAVKNIVWDAKGQKLSALYGNNIKSNYKYDPWTYDLKTLVTTNNKLEKLQDLTYQYDPVGNIIFKADNSQDTVFHNNQSVKAENAYSYDSLNRLISASGREKAGGSKALPSGIPILSPVSGGNDNQSLENYIEKYQYDLGGNLTKTTHTASSSNWSRSMIQSVDSNRSVISTLKGTSTKVTRSDVDGFFDPCGNQIKSQSLSPLEWNYSNNLWRVTTVKRDDGTSDTEYYVYDGSGNRIRKINEKYGNSGTTVQVNETIYLGNLEIRNSYSGAAESAKPDVERHSLKILDGHEAVATRDWWAVGKPPNGIDKIFLRYQLSDKLRSCTVELDVNGKQISREEYSPYGSSALFIGTGSASQIKNYRYGGKERDSVTGFYYYGARYYASWLGRWMSTDPAGTIDGLNIYAFLTDNPTSHEDIGGMGKSKKRNEKDPLKRTGRGTKRARGRYNLRDRDAIKRAIDDGQLELVPRVNVVTRQSDLAGSSKSKGRASFYSSQPSDDDMVRFTQQKGGVMAMLKVNGTFVLSTHNGKASEGCKFENIGRENQKGLKKNFHAEDWLTQSFKEIYEHNGEKIPARTDDQRDADVFSLRVSSSPCLGCVQTIKNFKENLQEHFGQDIILRVKFLAPYDLPSSLTDEHSQKAENFLGAITALRDAEIPYRIMPAKSVQKMNSQNDGEMQNEFAEHIQSLLGDQGLTKTWGEYGVSRKG